MSYYDVFVQSGQVTPAIAPLQTQVNALTAEVDRAIYSAATTVGTGSQTLVAANIQSGLIVSTPAAPATFTTPTAALLVAGGKPDLVGQGFQFTIVNLSSNAITVAAGTGVTLIGAVVVAANTSGTFYGTYNVVTLSSEAVTIYRM